VVVLGYVWRDLVFSALGVDPGRVHVVHNGVSKPSGQPVSADNQDVLFLGRMEELKGVPELIAAWGQVSASSGRLILAGVEASASTVAMVKRAAQRDHSIDYRGYVSRDVAAALLHGARVVVLASYAEGLPMALVEAMALGVPCIATDVGAVSELVEDGVNGFLVRPGDVETLAARLRVIMADDDLHRRLSREAVATWEAGFRADDMCEALLSIWRGLRDSRC